jgi:drug/metabolite transporter (DMT)-like permease
VFPLIVTALSPWLLGETVGPIRRGAVALGFLGALMIIRPGLEPVGAGQLFALAAAVVYALYAVLTRRMAGGTGRLTQLLWTVIGALALTGALAPYGWRMPDATDLALMALCGVLSGIAHLMIIAAYSEAEATAVVPFSYLQIAFGAAIGYAVWGNLPDALSWGGIALIAGGGIVVALRSKTPPQVRGGGRA